MAAVVVVGVALRLTTRSELWLDEALSVSIASLPIGDLLEALRHDGHPPLYYLLLNGWMGVFGDGNEAVRSLSLVCSLANLPLLWLAAREHAGRIAAWAALLLLASSPFAIRYATEARMYALVSLLVTVGWLGRGSRRALPRRSTARPGAPARSQP